MDLGVSGLASGFDWKSLVDQLVEVERAPEQRMLAEQDKLGLRNNAFSSLKTELTVLTNRIEDLKEATFFGSRLAESSNTSVGTASASANAPLGQYAFNILHLATASVQNGASNIAAPLSSSPDVSTLVLKDAAFATPVKGGTFTVNGRQISIADTDTLGQVFDKISTATSGAVTAAYDPATDHINLTSTGEIVLGSATDTSNFLLAARLANNGTGTVGSSSSLGGLKTTASLASANVLTPIDDGGAGEGEFKINGVSISFDASTDSIATVLARINSSAAGVNASYDSKNDRLVLVNKVTGDLGVALEDVTGNFLAATGLSGGQLQRGTDLVYTVNNGDELSSHSNTITEDSSGIAGLSLAVSGSGQTAVTVGSDTANIKKAIQDLVEAYNKVQKFIDTQTASTTDAKGKVTAGVLAEDSDAAEIASRLRTIFYSPRAGLTGTWKGLADLGFQTNGTDNSLTLEDEDKLDAALANGLSSVQAIFSNATDGVAVSLADYLDKTIGDDGTLVAKQANLTRQSGDIDKQITEMERLIADRKQQLTDSFLAMETAQAKINQQLSYLQQRFGSSSSSSSS